MTMNRDLIEGLRLLLDQKYDKGRDITLDVYTFLEWDENMREKVDHKILGHWVPYPIKKDYQHYRFDVNPDRESEWNEDLIGRVYQQYGTDVEWSEIQMSHLLFND